MSPASWFWQINQREEWWINFPVYEAHIRGAAALIAVQGGGYGEVDDTALNAQDIGGPADAPAFSMSRADARTEGKHGRYRRKRRSGSARIRR